MRDLIGILLRVGWGALALANRTRSPMLGGVLFGLVGACTGAVVLGLCGDQLGTLTSATPDAWSQWAVMGAALVGYPLGAFGGILIIGRRRDETGSAWLAFLGALVGTGLGVGLYQGMEWAQRSLFEAPLLADILVQLTPILLIPALVSLGYGYRPTGKWARRLQELVPGGDLFRRGSKATAQAQAEPAGDQQPNHAAETTRPGACLNCDAAIPADSAFCGECGAPFVVLEV